MTARGNGERIGAAVWVAIRLSTYLACLAAAVKYLVFQ